MTEKKDTYLISEEYRAKAKVESEAIVAILRVTPTKLTTTEEH